ncbi:S1 family peptidase [Goodfellowiella coeruleoviolacea]|uniref:Streptogrisin C n=1 Tax=Goodfellowiella coeruleoviolacea TaxID=334858 RepID=A0AAE3GLV4_9PSEU|nr:S1 family peptidase [Goodfellowiella coeruleoviolacea]MCP2169950.1 streptogrisin C [Goodfellowiella coeruleoviolacea]
MRFLRALVVAVAAIGCLALAGPAATAAPSTGAATGPTGSTAALPAPAPIGGGSVLYTSGGSRCTAAFAATGGSTWYLIAGAGCGSVGATVYSGANVLVGVLSAAPYPAQLYSIIRVTNTVDWYLVPRVPPAGGSGSVVITGSTEAPVGASVCKYGSTTGWHCGTIQAKNMTINFGGGVVSGLTRTSVCAEPGDGGSGFISGTQAQGVLVGGSGNCSSGGTTYFKPINEILSAHGLALLTG